MDLSHSHCIILYTVQYTVYTVQCTVYTVQYKVYTVQYTVYKGQYCVFTAFTVQLTGLFTVYCTLEVYYVVSFILCTVDSSVYCELYT